MFPSWVPQVIAFSGCPNSQAAGFETDGWALPDGVGSQGGLSGMVQSTDLTKLLQSVLTLGGPTRSWVQILEDPLPSPNQPNKQQRVYHMGLSSLSDPNSKISSRNGGTRSLSHGLYKLFSKSRWGRARGICPLVCTWWGTRDEERV